MNSTEDIDNILNRIRSDWSQIQKSGALIFDLDDTLLLPDERLSASEALPIFIKLLKSEVPIALISGSPSAVVKKRITDCLQSEPKILKQLAVYANGGSSSFEHDDNGDLIEDRSFTEKNVISAEYLYKVKKLLENYLEHQFYLEEEEFQKLMDGWREKRNQQWAEKPIEFREAIFAPSVYLDLLEDDVMAKVKAGEEKTSVSYPFINTRLSKFDEQGELEGVAGFTPTGFYAFKKSKGDERDFDLRDWLLERLREDLGPGSNEIVMRKAGRSSIDIVKKGADKASAVAHFLEQKRRSAAQTFYFGDEFFEGGNDEPVASNEKLRSEGIQLLSLNHEQKPADGICWVGKSPRATHEFLERILA